MNQKEFYERLLKHDWYYDFSDDTAVSNRGREEEKFLLAEAESDPVKKEMYHKFYESWFSGGPWKTEKKRIPEFHEFIKNVSQVDPMGTHVRDCPHTGCDCSHS